MKEQKRNARKHVLVGIQADGLYIPTTEKKKIAELATYKDEAKEVAKDFEYEKIMSDVYDRIDNATSCLQVANIMTYCRKAS